jgi:hypothetical protein
MARHKNRAAEIQGLPMNLAANGWPSAGCRAQPLKKKGSWPGRPIPSLRPFVGLKAFEFLQLLRGADVLRPAGGALQCDEVSS